MARKYWLFKSEPTTYSFSKLIEEKKTAWDGVRNYRARNFLKECTPGDRVLFYHSVSDKAVVGIAEVTREAYPDEDPTRKGDWVKVDVKPITALKTPVTLADVKARASLKDLMLIRQSRLSVMPLKKQEFETILKMGGTRP